MQVSAAALISAEAEPWTNAESAAYSSLPAVTLVQTRGNCWVKLLSFHHGVPSSRLLPLTCLSLCHCLEKDFPSLPRSEKSMVRKARSASQLDSGMAMVPPKPCELGCIFGIFVWVWYFHAFLFWEKADTVSMCMCELFFPTACWHNVSENLPFSYYFIYLCLIRLKKAYWCAWQFWNVWVSGYTVYALYGMNGQGILSVCCVFPQVVWFQETFLFHSQLW